MAKLIVNQDFGGEVGNAQVTIGHCRVIDHHALSGHGRIHRGTRIGELALIITRLDPHETADPAGNYTITLASTADANDDSVPE